MTEPNISIGGDAMGNAFGAHSRVTIESSFNTDGLSSAKLEQIKQLLNAIIPLREEMKGKDIRELDQHTGALIDEMKKPAPSAGVLALSAKGICDAVKTVGAIATPVLSLVDKVVQSVL